MSGKLSSQFWFFLFVSTILSCTNENNGKSILNETFNENDRGWIEENASYHKIEIKDGFYFIHCKDSVAGRTSTFPLDKSYLYDLPSKYSVETSLNIVSSDLDTASCGLILESATFEYEFRFYNSGEIRIQQHDYGNKEYLYYKDVSHLTTGFDEVNSFNVKLIISDWDFDLYVNDQKCKSGKLSSKSWIRLAPFSGKLTKTKVDYLIINDVTDSEI